ncbi:hypothetical protein [Halomarina pelagica]|uniref:hypothetical protein n=1 Tax=Halomarina pelagica TaxID=2961599 RepID=UPI0020C53A75|nr:hypothetical protein [Halomarina sp. BND7]
MSDAETDVVTAEEDGVAVEKSFAPDDFPVPAIAFVVENARDDRAVVRVTDDLPDGVAPDDVGFHPEYGEDCWRVEDGRLVFERALDAAETYTTVYGLRDADLAAVERFLVEPTLDALDPAEADSRDDAGHPGRVDVPPVDAEAVLGSDDEATDGAERDLESGGDDGLIGPLPLSEPGVAGDDAADGSDGPTHSAAGGLATRLAAELESGDVDDGTREVLASHLGGATGSVDARIERLQADVADLRAYADALESFLDENGDAQRVLGDLREELASVAERVRSVEDRSTATRDGVREVSDRVDDLESTVADVEADLDAFEGFRERVASVFGAGDGV